MKQRISTKFGQAAGAVLLVLLLALPAVGVVIPGDPADGEIRYDTGTVNTGSEEISIGHRGTNGVELVTAIYLFQLPDFGSSAEIYNASLAFSFNDRSGSFAANPANADIWGLGYVPTTAIDTNWHLLGDTDTRTGNDLGTGIGANPVVKLADNYLSDEISDPNDDPYRMVLPEAGLTDFIGFLYDQGAVSGDYAVIRVNVDAPTSADNRGFDLASADVLDPAKRPVLSINENTVLMLDPFTDGGRDNGADPLDTDWYYISSSLNLAVVDDTAGIGDGNALEVEMLAASRRFLCGFPAITLSEPGDFIQFTCSFRPFFMLEFAREYEKFRMAVLNSGGSPVQGDTTSSSSVKQYEGYMVRMTTLLPSENNSDLSLVNTGVGDSFLGSSGAFSDFLEREENAIAVDVGTLYDMSYTITRTSATQMTTRVNLNGVVLNGMDPGTDTNSTSWAFVDTFDALGMGCNGGAVDFTLDNVRVDTSVPLEDLVPHEAVLTEVVEVETETQPSVDYTLEQATDLVAANWADSGYVVTGNGDPLRIYDPDAVEASKSYASRASAQTQEIFTEDLSAFFIVDDGNGVQDYGIWVTNAVPGACPFGTGKAMRQWDFTDLEKPELQGELKAPIYGPFQIAFQSCNQSVSTNESNAIRWRMGNSGQSLVGGDQSAFSLSWHADLDLSASFETPSNTTESVRSAPLSSGIHDIDLVANGSTNETYSYALYGESRTLDPLSYDVYVDGMLLNTNAEHTAGLGFSVNAAPNYDPALGLRRHALLGSSTSGTDPDVWFDNIILRIGEIAEALPITEIAVGSTTGFLFTSSNGVVYALQSSANPGAEFPVWDDAGMSVVGDGTDKVLFDPAGYDAGKGYRVVERD